MNKPWHEMVKEIHPYLFIIETPDGYGTGFLMTYIMRKQELGIATAYHVIKKAFEWRQPIKIFHYQSGKELFLAPDNVKIFRDLQNDLAIIRCNKKPNMNLPEETLPLIEEEFRLKEGVEIGWCGFPNIIRVPCFFSGHISYYSAEGKLYLVDGVVINGVSGAPAFYYNSKNQRTTICGVISSYIPNLAIGKPLPGISVIRSVEPYHKMLKSIKTEEQWLKIIESQKELEERLLKIIEDIRKKFPPTSPSEK